MAEEDKNVNSEDAIVSDEEIKKIEAEVLKKSAAKEVALREKLESEIRAKLEAEAKAKAEKERLAALEASVARAAAEKEEMLKKHEEELKQLKERTGSTKSVVDSQSPFKNSNDSNDFDVKNLSQEQVRDIDDESKRAFLEKHGLRSDWTK